MSLRKLTSVFCLVAFMVVLMACDSGHGMIRENGSMTMNNSNWSLIMIGLGFGLLIGLLIWLVAFRKKE
ncbi:MAG TPA: LPXTG cell wall anchor domain-containing protein [Prolixibacteraceae bacterium]|nr:LPXTG cell wall anchor domain-containing protein [Prolixibacteraceae bacterium]